MEAYDSGAAVAWRRIRLFGCFNGAMSFDLQFSLFASTILPQKTLRKCWSYKCQLSYKSQVTCFRLISSPGIYPVLQSSFLHSELRYLQSADLWFCFLSPWRNGPEGSSTIVFLGEDRWDDHGLLLQVIWCSSCVIWGFSDSGSQQKRGRVDDHTRIRFLSILQTTAPWESRTIANKKGRWSRGCGCHWLSLAVSRKAFVDVMMSKCGVCRDPLVLSVMPSILHNHRIVIIDLLKLKPKISWYSYPTTGSLYLA